jgi:very-short-patch-repair endonuclease
MTDIAPHTRANARRLRAEMTPQERKLWTQLRDLNNRLGLNIRRQAPIGRYIADFVEFGRKLVIEVDGGQHGGPEDAARDAWFAAEGFTVLRVWNSDVDGNLEGVMQLVLDALEGGLE